MSIKEQFPEFRNDLAIFIEVCHRLYENKFVCAYDGNVSIRRGEHILITPTHLCKGDLAIQDLLIVNGVGEQLYGEHRATSELKMHLAVYHAQPEICCIIHAHPLYTTAIYRNGKDVDVSLLTEAKDSLGIVPVVPFATPGSDELASGVGQAMKGAVKACVMERHGVVVAGHELLSTYYLLESLERLARTESIIASMKL